MDRVATIELTPRKSGDSVLTAVCVILRGTERTNVSKLFELMSHRRKQEKRHEITLDWPSVRGIRNTLLKKQNNKLSKVVIFSIN